MEFDWCPALSRDHSVMSTPPGCSQLRAAFLATTNQRKNKMAAALAARTPIQLVKKVWERIAPLSLAETSWDNVS